MTQDELYRLVEQLEEATIAKAYAEERYTNLKVVLMRELRQHYPTQEEKGG